MTAVAEPFMTMPQIILSIVLFGLTITVIVLGARPLMILIRQREQYYDLILRGRLLMDVRPRIVTIFNGVAIVILGVLGWLIIGNVFGGLIGVVVGVIAPTFIIRFLRKRRLDKLEDQLVGGVQTLASGVRAGLNLVQAMERVARDGARPIREEFAHLLREYEYGVPLDEAMANAADRIGSSDYRLLFSALQTHRERGGDLGDTLDRIASSINEIQRLENRVKTLTAQGRANARFLGGLVIFVLGILYIIQPGSVRLLFVDDAGKLILTAVVILNILGFLWIKKIISIDI